MKGTTRRPLVSDLKLICNSFCFWIWKALRRRLKPFAFIPLWVREHWIIQNLDLSRWLFMIAGAKISVTESPGNVPTRITCQEAVKSLMTNFSQRLMAGSTDSQKIISPKVPFVSSANSQRNIFIHSFIPDISRYQVLAHSFVNYYSEALAPDHSIDTVSELTRRSATGNCEWRTCPRSLHDS